MMRFWVGLVFASLGLSGIGVARAEEVAAGYVINKANLSATDKQTFEGHNLGAMLSNVQRKMISELGLTIKLGKSRPIEHAPKLLAATAKYSGGVRFDKATRRISGYVTGLPFPNLSESDPDVADKIIWNRFYSDSVLPDLIISSSQVYAVDGTKGLERSFSLVNTQMKLTHRSSMEPVAPKFIGDGSVYRKTLAFNIAPQDVAGTGAYIQRYDDGRVDDSWAYIKSIRRVRRMSGGTWMDPIPGTDLLNDDGSCSDAFPTWYPKYKLVGKQWRLAVVHGAKPPPGYKIEDVIDMKNPPYWNITLDQAYEPREVFVVDAFPPEYHPYGRKRLYYDIQGQVTTGCDMYDKKDVLWKTFIIHLVDGQMADGQPAQGTRLFMVLDFQRMHGSIIDLMYIRQNEIRLDHSEISAEALTDSEKFSVPRLTKRFGPGWLAPVKN